MSLAGLNAAADQLTIAREHAMLGDYDTARVYYQGVISQVARHCRAVGATSGAGASASDAHRARRWLGAQSQLNDELESVAALAAERAVFSARPGTASSPSLSREGGRFIHLPGSPSRAPRATPPPDLTWMGGGAGGAARLEEVGQLRRVLGAFPNIEQRQIVDNVALQPLVHKRVLLLEERMQGQKHVPGVVLCTRFLAVVGHRLERDRTRQVRGHALRFAIRQQPFSGGRLHELR